MDKVKKIKIKKLDGSLSEYLPIGVDAKDVDMQNGNNLEEELHGYDRVFDSVAEMISNEKRLAAGMGIRTLGYYKVNDGGAAEYKITNVKSNINYQEKIRDGLYATLIVDNSVSPEMIGCYGDGIHDDTLNLQKYFDCLRIYKYKGLMNNKYLISNSVIIKGNYIYLNGLKSKIIKKINNTSAIIIENTEHSTINLGSIESNFNGIEIRALTGFTQYLDLSFDDIIATEKCVFFNLDLSKNTEFPNTWINEVRIFNGRLGGFKIKAKYGFYADSKNVNKINNIKIYNTGLEGLNTGIYLANNCNSWSFYNLRCAEDFTTLFESIGENRKCDFYNSNFIYFKHLKISNMSYHFVFHDPITKKGGEIISNLLEFNGKLIHFKPFNRRSKYYNQDIVNIELEDFVSVIGIGSLCREIHLNSNYVSNDFYIQCAESNNLKIFDYNNEVILEIKNNNYNWYKIIHTEFSSTKYKIFQLNNVKNIIN